MGRAGEGVSPSRKGGSGDIPRENFRFMDASVCVFNAFWRHLHFHNGTLTHRTIDTVSGLRIVMHANSKRFIPTLI